MAAATGTALLIAAGIAAATTAYSTDQKKKAAKDAGDKQDLMIAGQEAEFKANETDAKAKDKATRDRSAALAKQKAAQGSGRDSTILTGVGAPDPTTSLGESSGKTLLGM